MKLQTLLFLLVASTIAAFGICNSPEFVSAASWFTAALILLAFGFVSLMVSTRCGADPGLEAFLYGAGVEAGKDCILALVMAALAFWIDRTGLMLVAALVAYVALSLYIAKSKFVT